MVAVYLSEQWRDTRKTLIVMERSQWSLEYWLEFRMALEETASGTALAKSTSEFIAVTYTQPIGVGYRLVRRDFLFWLNSVLTSDVRASQGAVFHFSSLPIPGPT